MALAYLQDEKKTFRNIAWTQGNMESSGSRETQAMAMLLLFIAFAGIGGVSSTLKSSSVTCPSRPSPCYLKIRQCPAECPVPKPSDPLAKGCFLDCNSPLCQPACRGRKPNCNSLGAGCYDPRFIGADGIMFYFHGKKDEHFSLVSNAKFQINARFIGHRPAGRSRDFTWMQALGIIFGSHAFTIEATRAEKWDDSVDHFKLSYDGQDLELPEGHLSEWRSPPPSKTTAAKELLTVERTGSRNSVVITVEGMAEVSISVVPITEEDDRIHKYGIPSDDCYAHLEVQFKFLALSPEVDGVLGRTYRSDFQNTAKAGVAMPVVGGEDKYRTSSLLSPDCNACLFYPVADN